MSKPFNVPVARVAAERSLQEPPILYSEQDCQRFIRRCITDLGGTAQYSGSNDMFRNACEEVYPLEEALSKGLLQSGWYLFIVEPVSKSTPVKYQGDGKGDAGHIGMYTDQTINGTYVEVAHSSASRGRAAPSTLKNAWNYAGKPKDIAFDEGSDTMTEITTTPGYGTVIASPSLRMRKTPGTDGQYMQKVPEGARVQIVETCTVDGKVWGRTSYAKHEGWVQVTDYVRMDQEDVEGEAPASTPATVDDRILVEVTRYKGGPLTSEQALKLVTELLGSDYTATPRRV